MARFLRTETNSSGGHTRLRPPVVVRPAPLARPIISRLADPRDRPRRNQLQRGPYSHLRPPVVVEGSITFRGPGTRLTEPQSANDQNRRRKAKPFLRAPVLVFAPEPIVYEPIAGYLTKPRDTVPPTTKAVLRKPVVVNPGGPSVVYPPIKTSLDSAVEDPASTIRRRRPRSRLGKPIVIGAGIAYFGPNVLLAPSSDITRRRRPKYFLRPPTFFPDAGRVRGSLTKPRDTAPSTISLLRPPTVVATGGVFFGPKVEITRSSRGKPKSRLLPVPAAFQPFRPEITHLAYAPTRARAKSHLSAPSVVGSVLARAIDVTLAPQRRGVPKSRRILPTVVAASGVFAGPKVDLARSARRERATSHLFSPAVVETARAQIRGFLTKPRDTVPRAWSRLSSPTVLFADTTYAVGPMVQYVRTPRATPKSGLNRPAVIAPAYGPMGGVGVSLAYSLRGRPKSRLNPPAAAPVVAAIYYGPKVDLAPSFRGKPKSRLLRVPPAFQPFRPAVTHLTYTPSRARAKSHLSAPAVVGPVLARPIDITLAPQKRGRPEYVLRAPVVVGPVLARPIKTALVRIRPVKTDVFLRRPADLVDREDLGFVRTHLAYSLRGRPKSRLKPPTVVAPVLARAIKTTFVRIRPARTDYFLRRPTDLVDRDDIGVLRAHLAYSRRGVPKSKLNAPTVVSAFAARPVTIKLARIRPAKTSYQVAPPFVIDEADGPQGGVGIWLAPSFRGAPKSTLRPPAVITSRVEVTAITVSLAYSSRGIPKSALGHPVVINAVPRAKGRTATQFTQPPRIPIHSRLRPPAVVTAAAQAYYGPTVKLAESTRGKAKPFLLKVPSAFQPFRPAIIHLTYATRGRAKSVLFEPAIVAPVLARAIEVTLAPQKRGVPKSILRKPIIPPLAPPIAEEIAVKITLASLPPRRAHSRLSSPAVVAPVLARAIDATLARIRPPRTDYVIRRPVDLVDREDLGYVRAHLAYSLRGIPKSRLEPPAVVAPVLARAIQTHLAQIRPAAVHSLLRRPVDLVDREDLGYVRVHLAYALRGTPKSRLEPPTVVAPVLARPIEVTLARILPARTLFEIKPPAVVYLAVEIYGPETSLAPSFRGIPKSFLNPPIDLVDREDIGYLRTHLAYSLRGAPKSFLRPMGSPAVVYAPIEVELAPSTRIPRAPHSKLKSPTVIDVRPQTYFPSVTLAYSLRGTAKPALFPPPTIQATAKAETVITVTLAYSLRGTPKSKLKPPTVVTAATAYLRPIDVTFAPQRRGVAKSHLGNYIVPAFSPKPISVSVAPSSRGQAKPFLREVIYGAKSYAPISVTLAPQKRGVPKSLLRKVIYDAKTYAPISVALAPQRRGVPKSNLSTVIYGARSFEPISVTLAPQRRGVAKSRLEQVVYGAKVYAPIHVQLAYSRRGIPKSLLHQNVYEARVYAPVKVTLAASPRLDRTPHSRLVAPSVVGRFTVEPISVTLAPSHGGKTISRLQPPTAVARFIAEPTKVQLARTKQKSTFTFLRLPTLAREGSLGPKITLTRIRPARTISRLLPPAVVNPYVAPAVDKLAVTLAYSLRGRPKSRLTFLAGRVVPGMVCGMVLDLSMVCETIMTDTNAILPGGVLDSSAVHGDVTGSEVIMGEDLSIYRVDQEIE